MKDRQTLKNLYINGVEVARIEAHRNRINNRAYFIESENGEAIEEVSRDAFIKYLNKIFYTCVLTWSDELFKDFMNIIEEARGGKKWNI